MKITVESKGSKCYRVYLDGKEVSHVTEVDTDEGYLIRFKTHNGKIVRSNENDGLNPEYERLEGNVTVELVE